MRPKSARELARALDRVAVHAFSSREVAIEEIISALESVEKTFLSVAEGDNKASLDIQRRVAERKLSIVGSREAPFQLITELFGELERLGFADLERRATFEMLFSTCCMHHNQYDSARNILAELHSAISIELLSSDSIFYRELQQKVEQLLERAIGQSR